MQDKPRSRLQLLDIRKWLNKKCQVNAKETYKFLPQELNQRRELEQLFNQFDEDRSNALDFEEVLTMFNKYGFKVTRKQLMRFFNIVDGNKDLALNMDEFKSCMLDEEAKKCFTQIMKEVNQRIRSPENWDKEQFSQESMLNPEVIRVKPVSFQKIINLITQKFNKIFRLSYFISREKITEQIYLEPLIMQEQFPNLQSMVQLSSIIEITQPKVKSLESETEPKLTHFRSEKTFNINHLKKDLDGLATRIKEKTQNEVRRLIKVSNNYDFTNDNKPLKLNVPCSLNREQRKNLLKVKSRKSKFLQPNSLHEPDTIKSTMASQQISSDFGQSSPFFSILENKTSKVKSIIPKSRSSMYKIMRSSNTFSIAQTQTTLSKNSLQRQFSSIHSVILPTIKGVSVKPPIINE